MFYTVAGPVLYDICVVSDIELSFTAASATIASTSALPVPYPTKLIQAAQATRIASPRVSYSSVSYVCM